MTTNNNPPVGWDEPLPPPQTFSLLPEGDAQFEVKEFKRARKEKGSLGTCNVAEVTFLLASFQDPDNPAEITEDFPLHPKMSWKLYQLFASIGQYKHGDVEAGKPFQPDWNKLVGASGLCVISHRRYAKKGEDKNDEDKWTGVAHQIAAFLDEQGRARAKDEPRKVGAPVAF